jgi:Uma2 family endonuclease
MSVIAHLTLQQYDRMIESGIFDASRRQRLELIRGEIRELSPIGPEHEDVVDRLTASSYSIVAAGTIRVRVQNSAGLPSLGSAPEPDIAWVVHRDYSRGRPTPPDVLLIIEVAESSLKYDCGEKAELYAEAGIADYWVVNLPERSIEVRRDPAAGRYRSLQTCQGEQEIRPLALPDVVLRPAALWGTAQW